MTNPADGFAYNRIELGAIWELEVPVADIERMRLRRIIYFERVGDYESSNLVLRAAIADINNPAVLALGDFTDDGA